MTSFRSRVRRAGTIARLLPAYVVLCAIKKRVPVERLARWASSSARSGAGDLREADIIASVCRLRQLLRAADVDCLPRSLLLYRELSRAGADPRLCIGFRRDAGGVEGHAWVELRGEAIAERDPERRGFQPQVVFQAGSRFEGRPTCPVERAPGQALTSCDR